MPAGESELSVKGDLGEYPFQRTLYFLHEHNATGRMVMTRGAITKVVYMVEGKPVNVESTLRDETLGRYLVKKGMVTEEQFEESIQVMIEQGLQQGAALVKLGYLSPKDLYHEVKAQTREKLLTCFAWSSGEFSFYSEVEFVEDIYRFETSISSLMREGITRFFPNGAIERQMVKAHSGPILPVAGFVNEIGAYGLDEEESAFIMCIDGEKDLLALRKEQEKYPFAPKLLYLLLVCGLIGVDGEPEDALRNLGDFDVVFPPVEDFMKCISRDTTPELIEEEEEEDFERASFATEDTPVAEEAAEPPPPPPPPPPAPAADKAVIGDQGPDAEKVIDDDQVMDDWGAGEGAPADDEFVEDDQDDVFSEDEIGDEAGEEAPPPLSDEEEEAEAPPAPPPTPPTPAPPKPAPASASDPRDESEILEFYMGLKNVNFFNLLGVAREAEDDIIKRSYRAIRSKYDKARFKPGISAEAQAKLEEIHTQLIRAYENLRTPADRKAYIESLEKKPEPPKVKASLRAEQYLQKGIAFVRNKDWPNAQAMFERAVEANPNDPEYMGYLGWTVYSNTKKDPEERRESAKKILREAIDRSPNVDSTHVFLAKILKDEGKKKDALDHFELAVLCNPKCKEAEREIGLHEKGEW